MDIGDQCPQLSSSIVLYTWPGVRVTHLNSCCLPFTFMIYPPSALTEGNRPRIQRLHCRSQWPSPQPSNTAVVAHNAQLCQLISKLRPENDGWHVAGTRQAKWPFTFVILIFSEARIRQHSKLYPTCCIINDRFPLLVLPNQHTGLSFSG